LTERKTIQSKPLTGSQAEKPSKTLIHFIKLYLKLFFLDKNALFKLY